jgi:D-alanyl-D-alanine carboxypeptidase/D-alanyl-D-alanine-endopeptidase (penicillin-binding protein 4)
MAVISVKDGRLLFQRNSEKLFTPASNMKVYTTAVALDVLGTDYRWRTSVYADSQPNAAGTINGDLVLYGRGAPDLVSASTSDNQNSLEALAQMLADRGLKHVRGNVVGDASYFRGEPIGDGWQWNDLQWYFGAEASALSVNGNSVDISITSATKQADKPSVVIRDGDNYFQITNNLATSDRSARYRIGVHKNVSDNNVSVWGEVPVGARGYGASLSVHDPARWASRLFITALTARGITVEGSAISRDSRVPENQRFDPANKTELGFVTSRSLAEIVKQTNKYSINLYAELILRTLGRVRGTPTAKDSDRERGDDEQGAALIRSWLARAGADVSTIGIHDGSGLSRLNLVTPLATAQLLVAIQRTAAATAFNDSLPTAATDGTLQGRLSDVTGKIHAKTGALTYDHTLSGYALTPSGEWLAFSIMSNDRLYGTSIRLIDQLASVLADGATNEGNKGPHPKNRTEKQ